MFHKNLLRIKWLKLGIQTTEFAVRNARPIYSISQSITIHGICYRRRAHAVRHVSVGYKWFLFATLIYMRESNRHAKTNLILNLKIFRARKS